MALGVQLDQRKASVSKTVKEMLSNGWADGTSDTRGVSEGVQ